MTPRKVYLLTSKGSIHFIATNLLAVYDCIKAYEPQMGIDKLKAYTTYMGMFAEVNDVAIPKRKGGYYTISKRLLCTSFKNQQVRDLFI